MRIGKTKTALKFKRSGMLLPNSSSALVVDRQGEITLVLSEQIGPTMPPNTALLCAVLSLSQDEAWVEQTVAEFERRTEPKSTDH